MSKNHNNNNNQKNNENEVTVEVNDTVEEKKEEIKIHVNDAPKEEEKKEESKQEEKKVDIKDLKPEVKGNKRVEEIDEEIKVLQRKLDKCFSPINQVSLDEKIKLLKAERNDLLKKKMKVKSASVVGGETVKEANITNNVIPAGRGIVMDSRATTTISI